VRLLALAIVLFACALVSCGGAPPIIRDELARAPQGTVTVVFFTDFQCPFCRRTHAALSAVLADRAGDVRVVLRHVPLRMHPDARSAARAAICGEALGAGEDLVPALYRAPDLGEEAVEGLVLERGVDRERYRACLADPATEARIARDTAMLDELGGDGVPLLYVGRKRLDGSQSRRGLERAIEDASREIRASHR
jgi:predicted DsbA family dithiol-disulfide isomerase